jgi:hypothetical protein
MSRAVKIMERNGISIRPSWLPFTPWTERADLSDIMLFLADHSLLATTDPIQLTIRLLLPENSLLLDVPGTRELLDHYDPHLLSYQWRSPDPELDRLHLDLTNLADVTDMSVEPWDAMIQMWRRVMPDLPPPILSDRPNPRLTESWFCCAEPTTRHLSVVKG